MLLLTCIKWRTMLGILACFYRWLSCLMSGTSSCLINCRPFLRPWGVAISFAAFLRDHEFLKHMHRIFQSLKTFNILRSVSFLFSFFFLKKQESKNILCILEFLSAERIARMLGTWSSGQTPTSQTLCGRSLCKALISLVKMAALLFGKLSVVIILPHGRIFV